ncbi:MAG: type II secretion system protein [Blastopirellula sp.]|nr:MAG: type II secretion system protein [Blastopirellula sp.]
MTGIIITSLIFLAGFLITLGMNLVVTDLFQKEHDQQRKRLEEQSREQGRQRVKEALAGRDLDDIAAEAMRETRDDQSLLDKLYKMLEQSGTEITMPKLLMSCLGCSLFFGLVVGLLTYSIPIAVLAALVVTPLPILYVKFKRQQRFNLMLEQLPDSLELMSRTLRSGQTITQAILSVANEFRPPIATEFGYCYEQQNLGLSADVALRDLAHRTGLLEIRIFVLGLLIHRRSGGNLTELLDNLATIIRDRHRMRGKVKALTAEGRLQALVLILIPIFAFFGMCVAVPSYGVKLLDYPWILIGCCISMALGAAWIRRIVNFDF